MTATVMHHYPPDETVLLRMPRTANPPTAPQSSGQADGGTQLLDRGDWGLRHILPSFMR
jgi:hypothetical protein